MNLSKTLFAIVGLTFLASCGQSETSSQNTTATTSSNTAENTISPYTYNDIVTYQTPAGDDSVRFVMTTDGNGTITSLETTFEEGNDMSKDFVKQFQDASKQKIIGKKISELGSVDAIGGASLTTDAFKKFIAEKV